MSLEGKKGKITRKTTFKDGEQRSRSISGRIGSATIDSITRPDPQKC
ncbi:hypothetical protein RDV78_09715 [Bacillota bacterium LX-D]|nr:hypothetical protein [Bacillota bacterium LX-D]